MANENEYEKTETESTIIDTTLIPSKNIARDISRRSARRFASQRQQENCGVFHGTDDVSARNDDVSESDVRDLQCSENRTCP